LAIVDGNTFILASFVKANMRATGYLFVALASLASVAWAEDLLFPYMHGLKYSEYDIAIKQGHTGRVAMHRTIKGPG
jgi:hypothetical protein